MKNNNLNEILTEEYYTIKEIANILKTCSTTIRRYILNDKLKAKIIARKYVISEADLIHFIENN